MSCGRCGNFGHNARTCGRTSTPSQPPSASADVCSALADVPEPEGLGPWNTCMNGDPYCPCESRLEVHAVGM